MMADSDIHCAPAPEPAAQPPSERAGNIEHKGGSPKKLKSIFVSVLLLMALLAVVTFVIMTKYADGAATAASIPTMAATLPQRAAETVASATVPDGMPAECAGDIADSQLRWYCQDFLPFAQKAVADHGRIDRLEAAGRGSGAPLGLWLLVIGIGILTVVNTLMILSKTRSKPSG